MGVEHLTELTTGSLDTYIYIFVNCNWVNTRWQCYSTHNQYIEQHHNNRTTQITAQHNNNRKTIAQHNDNYIYSCFIYIYIYIYRVNRSSIPSDAQLQSGSNLLILRLRQQRRQAGAGGRRNSLRLMSRSKVNVKSGPNRQHPTSAITGQRGSRGIALLFL